MPQLVFIERRLGRQFDLEKPLVACLDLHAPAAKFDLHLCLGYLVGVIPAEHIGEPLQLVVVRIGIHLIVGEHAPFQVRAPVGAVAVIADHAYRVEIADALAQRVTQALFLTVVGADCTLNGLGYIHENLRKGKECFHS